MVRRSRRKASHELNAWPGYVDALSTLLMVVTFVLLVFVLSQQFLATALNRRTHSLDALKREVAALQQTLSLKEKRNVALKDMVASISTERDEAQRAANASAAVTVATVTTLQAQIIELNAQLSAIAQALDVSQKDGADRDQQITNLGEKLNIALADKVNELNRYRSEFFEKLQQVLKNQKGISVVGDRFVLQSAILFPAGSAELTPEGRREITVLAETLHFVARRIPKDLAWILRVDGHADKMPIHSSFVSNWELSTARATTVVKALIAAGIDPHHLAATGFSDYQPLDPHDTPEAYARNRRIEFRLTDR